MASNIHSLIKFDSKEDYDMFIEKYFSETEEDGVKYKFFDLEKVIPMPKHPTAAHGVYNRNVNDWSTQRARSPGAFVGIEGDFDWFSWGARHWLTKWNTYRPYENPEKLEIWFDTAWSCPYPVIDVIVQLNPGLGKRIHGYDICEFNGHFRFNEWKTDEDYLEVITHDLRPENYENHYEHANDVLEDLFPIGAYIIKTRDYKSFFEESKKEREDEKES